MRSSVAAAWPAMCSRFEGRCNFLYLDTKKLPTTGLGYRVVDLAAMLQLPWLRKEGDPATPAQIEAEWIWINSRTDLATRGGFAYQAIATLHLPEAEIDRQLMATTARFWTTLAKNLPAIDSWPADAQLALMDLAWQNGPNFTESRNAAGGYVWSASRASYLARDWTRAAAAVPGSGARAGARSRLFRNAAAVDRLGLDPDVLWDTKTPTAPVVVAPPVVIPPAPQEKPAVHYSSAYRSDYTSFRGGYVPPVVAEVLKAIPSPVELSQGGLSSSVAASAQTHNGLGAYDIAVKGWSRARIMELCRELIRSGECAFPRGGMFGSSVFVTHVHVCSNNSFASLHPEAQAQVRDFKAKPRRNGLVGHGRYVGPNTPLGSWGASPYNPENIEAVDPAESVYYVDVAKGSTLLGLNVDRGVKLRRKRGERLVITKIVRRWGRRNAVTAHGTYYALELLTKTKPA